MFNHDSLKDAAQNRQQPKQGRIFSFVFKMFNAPIPSVVGVFVLLFFTANTIVISWSAANEIAQLEQGQGIAGRNLVYTRSQGHVLGAIQPSTALLATSLGVRNDGSDVSGEFRAAINTAIAQGKDLYFPAGTYLLGTVFGRPVTFTSNFKMIGADPSTTKIKFTSNTGIVNVDMYGFTVSGNYAVAFQDITLEGPDNASGYTIVGVDHQGTSGAINLQNVTFSKVTQNYIAGSGVTITQSSAPPAPDTAPPSVSLTSPTAGTVSGTIALTASASDNVGVAGVQFKVDGSNSGTEDTASPYTINLVTTTLANGTHTISAVARDAAGNTTTSAAVSVTVNNAVGSVPTITQFTASSTSITSGQSSALTWNVNGATTVTLNGSTVSGTSQTVFPTTTTTYTLAASNAIGNATPASLTITVQGAAPPPSSASCPAASCINVKNAPFNAKGDGVTDDGIAIKKAFRYQHAHDTTITTIYVPAGRYLIDSRYSSIDPNDPVDCSLYSGNPLCDSSTNYRYGIRINSSVTVIGDGMWQTVFKATPHVVNESLSMFTVNYRMMDASGTNGTAGTFNPVVLFRDVTFEGPNDENGGSWCTELTNPADRCAQSGQRTTNALRLQGSGTVTVLRTSTLLFTHGYWKESYGITGTTCGMANNLYIQDSVVSGTAMGALGACGSLNISNSIFKNTGQPKGSDLLGSPHVHVGRQDHHLYIQYATSIDINNSYFDNNYGLALQNFEDPRTPASSYIRVTNSTFGRNQRNGILGNLFYPATYTNNTFLSTVTNNNNVPENVAIEQQGGGTITANGNRFSNTDRAIDTSQPRGYGADGSFDNNIFDGYNQPISLWGSFPSNIWTVSNSKFRYGTNTILRNGGSTINASTAAGNVFNWAGDSNTPGSPSAIVPAVPIVLPNGGTFASSVTAHIYPGANGGDGEEHYTLDGSTPTLSSPLLMEGIRMNVSTNSTTLNVRTFKCTAAVLIKNCPGANLISGPVATKVFIKGSVNQSNQPDAADFAIAGSTSPAPTPAPTASLSAAPATINSGQSSTLTWSTTNASSVSITNLGSVAGTGSQSVSPTTTTTYTLTATGSGGTATATATVTVTGTTPGAPTATISASPTSITSGQSSTLTWSTTNATSVSISSLGTVAASGSRSVSPSATTTYTITATGSGGSTTASAIVTVTPAPAPTASLSATPTTITSGQQVTLAWSSSNATSVSITGLGPVAASGSQTVSPTSTTTYLLTAVGNGGTVTQSVTVTVTPAVPNPIPNPVPTATLLANPTTITIGQSTTLSWATTNATAVSVDNGIDSVRGTDTLSVSPKITTTYVLTAAGKGGTVTASATVTVLPVPVIVGGGGNSGGGNSGGGNTGGGTSGTGAGTNPGPTPITPVTPTAPTGVLPSGSKDGDLVSFGGPAIFLVKSDGLYPFATYGAFQQYTKQSGKSVTQVNGSPSAFTQKSVTADSLISAPSNPTPPAPSPISSTSPAAPGSFASGSLVNDNGTIYFVYGTQKVAFTSYKAFTGLGYSTKQVVKGDTSTYQVDTTYYLSSAAQSHPWGQFLKNGKTLYYSASQGLIPISSYDVFLSNGGNLSLVVNMNKADLSLLKAKGKLPVLEANDARVTK
jgi:hypothetical protein